MIVTFVSVLLGVDKFTSNVNGVPSVAFVSFTLIVAVSSSMIVPVPVSLLPGIEAVIVNVSSVSDIESSVELTSTVTPVEPAGIVTVIFVSV